MHNVGQGFPLHAVLVENTVDRNRFLELTVTVHDLQRIDPLHFQYFDGFS
ncbi:hypothetical protein ACFW1P_13115 [Paenibacillus sp. NPDC058910]